MKKLMKISVLCMMLTGLLLGSCKKEDMITNNTSMQIVPVITTGSWRISSFTESGSDHTADFTSYAFTFGMDGFLTANREGSVTNGSWEMDNSNSNEFKMSLGNTDPLKDLGKGWLIVSVTINEIILQDDDGSMDRVLHFIKL